MTNITGLLPSVSYRLAEKAKEGAYEKYAARRDVKADVDRYVKALAKVNSVDDLFKNARALEFVALANGIPNEVQYPGRLKAALLSDPDDPQSLINRLNNPALKEVQKILRLREDGVATLKKQETVDGFVDSYLRTKYEQSLAGENPEVSRARYFKKNIAEASDNVYDILGDSVLREVVTKALGLPQQIAVQPVETQARAITSRLNLSRFQDPAFVDKFIQRYLNVADTERQQQSQGSGLLALFSSSSGSSSGSSSINILA